jgi:8-oxo-dGTP pyrophosphatase MutT (NUDIX family)
MPWRRRIEPFTRPFFKVYSRLGRGMTLGVRGLVVDDHGRVLLIEHTYLTGWFLPGGGVDRGESCETAVVRELIEEAGVRALSRPRLLSMHDNNRKFRGDHVLLYQIDRFELCPATSRGEIAQVGWFHPHALPEPMNPGSKRRIEEALGGAPADVLW